MQTRFGFRSRLSSLLIAAALLLGTASHAAADVTGFLGVNGTPVKRSVKGVAVGAGLLIAAFEVEYADTSEDVVLAGPRLRTVMFNGIAQTPFPIGGLQLYATLGGGFYKESFSNVPGGSETSVANNVGGGAKISLAGPLRLRLDYRFFNLKGSPQHANVQRFYAGINLKF
jgi:opacity protein-like surface antigen